jgi:hypothetical protein
VANAFKRAIEVTALSIPLACAFPVLAQNNVNSSAKAAEVSARCDALLANRQGSLVNEAVIGQTGLKIQYQSIFHGQPKSVFLAPVDSWGRGENAKHLFVAAMRLERSEDAVSFLNELVAQTNATLNSTWKVVQQKENVFEIPGICTARTHQPYYTRHIPLREGSIELEIEIQQSPNEVQIAKGILNVLSNQFHLSKSASDLQHLADYDLSTFEGRAAWGYEAFHEWLNGLSSEARTALRLISGAEYRDILPFLRGGQRNNIASISTSQLQEFVSALDSAIGRGKIPVPVKLYRASAESGTLEAWSRLTSDKNAHAEPLVDSAYTFTSLDEQFVQTWNTSQLRGTGIVIEILANAGTRAGYVDRGTQARDYAEIILARGQHLVPIQAYITATGERRLVVTAK